MVDASSQLLAEEIVAETGFGSAADNAAENRFASTAVYRHLAGRPAAGALGLLPTGAPGYGARAMVQTTVLVAVSITDRSALSPLARWSSLRLAARRTPDVLSAIVGYDARQRRKPVTGYIPRKSGGGDGTRHDAGRPAASGSFGCCNRTTQVAAKFG